MNDKNHNKSLIENMSSCTYSTPPKIMAVNEIDLSKAANNPRYLTMATSSTISRVKARHKEHSNKMNNIDKRYDFTSEHFDALQNQLVNESSEPSTHDDFDLYPLQMTYFYAIKNAHAAEIMRRKEQIANFQKKYKIREMEITAEEKEMSDELERKRNKLNHTQYIFDEIAETAHNRKQRNYMILEYLKKMKRINNHHLKKYIDSVVSLAYIEAEIDLKNIQLQNIEASIKKQASEEKEAANVCREDLELALASYRIVRSSLQKTTKQNAQKCDSLQASANHLCQIFRNYQDTIRTCIKSLPEPSTASTTSDVNPNATTGGMTSDKITRFTTNDTNLLSDYKLEDVIEEESSEQGEGEEDDDDEQEVAERVVQSSRYSVWEAVRCRSEIRREFNRQIKRLRAQVTSEEMTRNGLDNMQSGTNHPPNNINAVETIGKINHTSSTSNLTISSDPWMSAEERLKRLQGQEGNNQFIYDDAWSDLGGNLHGDGEMSEELDLVALCFDVAALKGKIARLKSGNKSLLRLNQLHNFMLLLGTQVVSDDALLPKSHAYVIPESLINKGNDNDNDNNGSTHAMPLGHHKLPNTFIQRRNTQTSLSRHDSEANGIKAKKSRDTMIIPSPMASSNDLHNLNWQSHADLLRKVRGKIDKSHEGISRTYSGSLTAVGVESGGGMLRSHSRRNSYNKELKKYRKMIRAKEKILKFLQFYEEIETLESKIAKQRNDFLESAKIDLITDDADVSPDDNTYRTEFEDVSAAPPSLFPFELFESRLKSITASTDQQQQKQTRSPGNSVRKQTTQPRNEIRGQLSHQQNPSEDSNNNVINSIHVDAPVESNIQTPLQLLLENGSEDQLSVYDNKDDLNDVDEEDNNQEIIEKEDSYEDEEFENENDD